VSTYFLRRILQAVLTLSFLITITFFLLRLAPGGPFDGEKVWPPEIQRHIEAKYGLNRPVFDQFTSWVGSMAHGDFRESFHYIGTPVSEIIVDAIPPSFQLGGLALVFSVFFGVLLGVISAWKRGTWLDFYCNLRHHTSTLFGRDPTHSIILKHTRLATTRTMGG
jgi:oligopeptide transport system permease protein